MEFKGPKRKYIPQKLRLLVYDKFNGHCAYCGCKLKLKDMQIDHIESVCKTTFEKKSINDSEDNYMPSCRMCNYYKSIYDLENLRHSIKNVLVPNLKKTFNYRLAEKYGLVKEIDKPIVFFFEKFQKDKTNI